MRKINKLRTFLMEYQDQKEARVKIGQDKFGNDYYQYYSHFGLPTRRECELIDRYRYHIYRDNAYYCWMMKQQLLPPTKTEIRNL